MLIEEIEIIFFYEKKMNAQNENMQYMVDAKYILIYFNPVRLKSVRSILKRKNRSSATHICTYIRRYTQA